MLGRLSSTLIMSAVVMVFIGMNTKATKADDSYEFLPLTPAGVSGFVEGGNLRNIKIEGFYDLMCGNCSAFHPPFNAFLDSPVNDVLYGQVKYRDLVEVHSNFMPLTFHQEVWNTHLILPYLWDRCNKGHICRHHDYVQWCADNHVRIRNMKDMSQDDFLVWLRD